MAFRVSGLPAYKFTPPSAVFKTLVDDLSLGRSSDFIPFREGLEDGSKIIVGVVASLYRVIYSYGASLLIGVAIGLMLVASKGFNWLFGPLVLGVQSLPSICWLPVAILWFGLNEKAILFVVIMGSVGSIAMATRDGLMQVPVTYQRVASTFGASLFQRMFMVSIPAAFPVFISGLKQGWSFAWRSLLAGELIFGNTGVGGLLSHARDLADYPQMFAVMILIVVISVLIDKVLFSRLEERVRVRWGLAGK